MWSWFLNKWLNLCEFLEIQTMDPTNNREEIWDLLTTVRKESWNLIKKKKEKNHEFFNRQKKL